MRWAELQIEAGAGASDAVGFALEQAGCQGFAVQDRAQPSSVAGYLPVDDRLEARLQTLKDALAALPSFGIEGAGTDITLRYVEEADWANAWKAFYKPMRVGRHLVVTPPWETPDLAPGDLPIIIDPGMAFGTGSHPTTQLCLEALEDVVHPGCSLADVGTGSGILAIAAAKLGAASVLATDIDPLAVKIARENALANGVKVEVQEPLPQGVFDILVANILADVVIGLSQTLASLTGGTLIASGIIDTRAEDVRTALHSVGFGSIETRTSGEWVALICRREASA